MNTFVVFCFPPVKRQYNPILADIASITIKTRQSHNENVAIFLQLFVSLSKIFTALVCYKLQQHKLSQAITFVYRKSYDWSVQYKISRNSKYRKWLFLHLMIYEICLSGLFAIFSNECHYGCLVNCLQPDNIIITKVLTLR